MTAVARRSARPTLTQRRRAALLGVSVVSHAMVLGAFAFRTPSGLTPPTAAVMDVALVDLAPFVRPQPTETVTPPPTARVVMLHAAPRHAAAKAPTGNAGDAIDLFGPVFADGMWPRPLLVRSEPCDPKGDIEMDETCRRELLLIGLASEAAAGAKAQP